MKLNDLGKIALLGTVGFVAVTLPYSGWHDWCYVVSLLPDTFDHAGHSTTMGILISIATTAYIVVVAIYSQE